MDIGLRLAPSGTGNYRHKQPGEKERMLIVREAYTAETDPDFEIIAEINLGETARKKTEKCCVEASRYNRGGSSPVPDDQPELLLPADQPMSVACKVSVVKFKKRWTFPRVAKMLGISTNQPIGRALIERRHIMTLPQNEAVVEYFETTGMRIEGNTVFFSFAETKKEVTKAGEPVAIVLMDCGGDAKKWRTRFRKFEDHQWEPNVMLLIPNL